MAKVKIKECVLAGVVATGCIGMAEVSATDAQAAPRKTGYQNPSKYYQITLSRPNFVSKNYILEKGVCGYRSFRLKEKKLRQRVDWYNDYYDATTSRLVKNWQSRHGVRKTGKVDKKTWIRMGFSADSWNDDIYVHPLRINQKSTKAQCINAMIATANEYKNKGTRYVWGASSKAGKGTDCSGLILQCLYSAGIYPTKYTSASHGAKNNERTTTFMRNDKRFKHVKYSKKKKGDLLLYNGHVAIYIGGGKMIEALSPRVKVSKVRTPLVTARVFN